MSIQKLPLLLAALTLSGAFATIAVDAEARERTRSRTASNVDGARSAAVNASGSGTNGSYARGRQWQADGQGRADNRLYPRPRGRLMEPRRAVDAVGVEERQRRIAERRRPLDERFGQRSSLEKTESRCGVEFYVHNRKW